MKRTLTYFLFISVALLLIAFYTYALFMTNTTLFSLVIVGVALICILITLYNVMVEHLGFLKANKNS